jgi:hypothetical protein
MDNRSPASRTTQGSPNRISRHQRGHMTKTIQNTQQTRDTPSIARASMQQAAEWPAYSAAIAGNSLQALDPPASTCTHARHASMQMQCAQGHAGGTSCQHRTCRPDHRSATAQAVPIRFSTRELQVPAPSQRAAGCCCAPAASRSPRRWWFSRAAASAVGEELEVGALRRSSPVTSARRPKPPGTFSLTWAARPPRLRRPVLPMLEPSYSFQTGHLDIWTFSSTVRPSTCRPTAET